MTLDVQYIESALVMPARRKAGGHLATNDFWLGGCFTAQGENVEQALLRRRGALIMTADDRPTTAKRLEGEFIFGGYLFPHFGHFLLESCHRLWFAKQRPDLPIIWVLGKRIAPYQEAILSQIGIRNRHVFIKTPMLIDKLHIPDQAYMIDSYCAPEMVQLMGTYSGTIIPGRKTWLSRTQLQNSTVQVGGEEEIERTLQENGWFIFHAQNHPTEDQLKVISESEVISGFSGSAFHNILMLRSYKGKVIICDRGGKKLHGNFIAIAEAMGLKQAAVYVTMSEMIDFDHSNTKEAPKHKSLRRLENPYHVVEKIYAAIDSLES